jgi:hypothetical protein
LPAPPPPTGLEAQILEILQDNSESFINIDVAGPDKKVCQNVTDEIMAAIKSSDANLPFSPVMRSIVDCIVERGNYTQDQVERAIHKYGEDEVWENMLGPAVDKIEDEVVGGF